MGEVDAFVRIGAQVIEFFAVGPSTIPPLLITNRVAKCLFASEDAVGMGIGVCCSRLLEQWDDGFPLQVLG